MLKEKWSKGKPGDCVVSDTPNRIIEDPDLARIENDTRDYYGGYLIAESIPKQEYVNLIKTAPKMLKFCKDILIEMRAYVGEDEFDRTSPQKWIFDTLKEVISEAEGKEAKDV